MQYMYPESWADNAGQAWRKCIYFVIFRTLIGVGVLSLCKAAVYVFCSPSRLGGTSLKKMHLFCHNRTLIGVGVSSLFRDAVYVFFSPSRQRWTSLKKMHLFCHILDTHRSGSFITLQPEQTKLDKFKESAFIFYHDLVPTHTVHSSKEWFSEKRISVLDWPLKSP